MKTRFFSIFTLLVLVAGLLGFSQSSASAEPATLYVDTAGVCGGNTPCYPHPQDAVNAANPGDTILVYPGTYGSRVSECPWKPNCSQSDVGAPALIVYKDGLTIKSVEGPANTIIEATHTAWSNAGPVERSTNNGIVGVGGWSPNASVIVANNVTIEGFTFHRPFNCASTNDCFWNTAGVFIGSKGAGYTDFLGNANGATVRNNVFSSVWHAVYIWHSSGNTITGNTVEALGNTGHWAAISSYDGWDDASAALQPQSTDLKIYNNTIADKGISLGAWAPATWTSSARSRVCSNTTTQVGVAYTHGPVLVGGNAGSFWEASTSEALHITGISYTGPTLVSTGSATLTAKVAYDGSVDGSGIPVNFKLNDVGYPTTTTVGGLASVAVNLPVGVYSVSAEYNDCGIFTDSTLLAVYDPTSGFVTGGGWITSPAGAYTASPDLTGKASFGFVAKYQKGASIPSGNTEFQFALANLLFKSTRYEWLVVAGAKAQFKGSGTINAAGDYGFMLTAVDGALKNNAPDTFRIKIWDKTTGDVIYDNMLGADDSGEPSTVLGGGSIVIHK